MTPNFELGKATNRILRVPNSNYKRNGTKSYVHALLKYHITPTLPGPYFMGKQVHHQGKFRSRGHERAAVGGRTTMQSVLMKRHHKPHKPHKTDPDTTDPGNTHPTPTTGPSGDTSGEVTAEDIQNDSEYLCPVTIGTPGQKLNLDFDTGSADLWVWSTELPTSTSSQYASAHTIYDPTKSSTYKVASGSTWQIQYGDSSTASGNVGTDNVTIGNITIENQAVELANTLSTQFLQGAGDGLLGLAWGNINTVKPTPVQTPVENMISQKDIPANAELFTAYLGSFKDANEADKGMSFYTFGEIDAEALSRANISVNDIHYIPIDNSQGFWQFPNTTATVGTTTVSLGASNTAIADTGTTLCLVSDALVEAVYKAIPGAKYDSSQQGWLFPSNTKAAQLPKVGFELNGSTFYVQQEDLAFADAGNGMTYGGIQSRGDETLDILGDVFLKGVYAIFDQGNKQLGLVQRIEQTQNTATS